ncbi:hypothetical protein P7C70_g375, partial [Phenoliferia sp. Uapishka_3]
MTSTNGETLLVVENLCAPLFESAASLWSGVSFSVERGTILCLVSPFIRLFRHKGPDCSLPSLLPTPISTQRGPSGSGKSVLLKCLAHLLVYPQGTLSLSGQSPSTLGVPVWRSKVLYLPQRPALLPGTPAEFWDTLRAFKSRQGQQRNPGNPWEIAKEWGIEPGLFQQTWGSLSGGESQRIALAISLALKPVVLLLDEPTSALDSQAASQVEATLLRVSAEGRQTCIWVTHSDEQAARVATESLNLAGYLHAEV